MLLPSRWRFKSHALVNCPDCSEVFGNSMYYMLWDLVLNSSEFSSPPAPSIHQGTAFTLQDCSKKPCPDSDHPLIRRSRPTSRACLPTNTHRFGFSLYFLNAAAPFRDAFPDTSFRLYLSCHPLVDGTFKHLTIRSNCGLPPPVEITFHTLNLSAL